MSIASSVRKAGPYVGNDVTTVFPFAFKVFTTADVRVVHTDLDGVETDWTLGGEYLVTLNSDQDNDPGGYITATDELPEDELLTLTSNLEITQPLVLTNNGGFYPRVINNAFDRITIIAQQIFEQLGRTLRLPISSTADATLPTPVPNGVIAWNSTGTGFTNIALGDLATVSAYADARVEVYAGTGAQTAFSIDFNPGVLANLDVSVGGVTQTPGVDYVWAGTTVTFTTAPPDDTTVVIRYARPISPIPNYDGYLTAAEEVFAFRDLLEERIAILDASAGGVVDVTADVQAWASAGGGLIPEGVYKISSVISLPAGFRAQIADGVRFVWAGGANPTTYYGAVFRAFNVTGVTIACEGEFTVESATLQHNRAAVLVVSCRDVRIEGLMAVNMLDFYADAGTAVVADGFDSGDSRIAYADVVVADPADPDFNANANVVVVRGGARFDTLADFGTGARSFYFCNGFRSEGGVFTNAPHGVQWWGGDSNPGADGALANERKCLNGEIVSPVCYNAHGAFVWGSMGKNIRVVGGWGDTCLDVGFDNEGGDNVSFVGCHGRNASNGLYATFFLNKGTLFRDCTGTQPPTKPIYRSYNSTLSQDNRDVQFLGGRFEGEGGITTFDNVNGPVRDMVVRGVTFVNVLIDLAQATNALNVTVEDNDLQFTVAGSSAFSAIEIAGAARIVDNAPLISVRNNRITSTVAQPAGSVGVDVAVADNNSIPVSVVENNSILPNRVLGGVSGYTYAAFTTDIRLVGNDPNGGLPSMFTVKNNSVATMTLTKAGSGPTRFVEYGNRDSINDAPVITMTGSVGWNFGSAAYAAATLVDGAGATTTVPVAGAVAGGMFVASFSADLQGVSISAAYKNDGNVDVRFQNETGGSVNLAAGTIRVRAVY